MSKDLIRGFLLAHNAPKEIMDALGLLGEPISYPTISIGAVSELPKLQDLLEDIWHISGAARVINVFNVEGIKTTEDLLKLTPNYLLRTPNFGRKSLNIVKEMLAKHNLQLGSLDT